MYYLAIVVFFVISHLLIKKYAADIVSDYLKQTNALLDVDQYTDGCTSPFKTYIHRYLKRAHELCAAHDFGSLGYLTVVRPGWHNNLITWYAHMIESNPVYWLWGTIVAVVTLPWVVWRRNWGIKWADMGGFYMILFALIALYYLIKNQPV